MRILWLTNIAIPEANMLMKKTPSPFGGWFASAAESLSNCEKVNLAVAFPDNKATSIIELKGKKIEYHAFPVLKNDLIDVNNNVFLNNIISKFNPDIVHIFGTEYPHTLAMVNVCNEQNIKVVISIQGLVSVYANHYMACLPTNIQNRITFRDFIKQDNLIQQQKKFAKRGRLELEALQKVKYVIGRTTWDKACVSQINPDIQYYHCNETLRDKFYEYTWDIDKCNKYSIFVSQGSYPIKGLHFILEAMPLILKRFRDAKLYVSGHNIVKTDAFKNKLKISSYGKYIKMLIDKYNLHGRIFFIGILNEKEICQRYLKSNVFVCPSIIENSPNSLGEAMILGVPCVASYVGGIPDLLIDKEEGFLYQADAPYMLAHYISEIFSNNFLALNMSKRAREKAVITHNRENNTKRLIQIYKQIAEKKPPAPP